MCSQIKSDLEISAGWRENAILAHFIYMQNESS